MPARLKAFICAICAIIVLILVVMIASGSFGGRPSSEPESMQQSEVETFAEETAEKDNVSEIVSTTSEVVATPETTQETTEEMSTTSDDRSVFLTFNNSPGKDTEKILDILKEKNVKATFFIRIDEDAADELKKISDHGHAIGVLSSSSEDETAFDSIEAFRHDVNECRQFIFQNTGELSSLYRFPDGSNNVGEDVSLNDCKEYLEGLDMRYYDWNINSFDDETDDAQTIAWNVIDEVRASSFKTNVVLMHDAADNEQLYEALGIIIDELKNDGFIFNKLSENTPEMTFDIE